MYRTKLMINSVVPFAWDDSMTLYEFVGKLVTLINKQGDYIQEGIIPDVVTKLEGRLQQFTKDEIQVMLQTGELATMVTNYIENIAPFRSEVEQARLGEVSLATTISKIKEDALGKGLNLKSYSHLVDNGDWSQAVNAAIDTLSMNGGGKLVIPQGDYNYGQDIHIKENVTVEGVQGVNFKQLNGAKIYLYSITNLKDINIEIDSIYNDGAIVFDNKHLRRSDTTISKPEGVKVTLERVRLTTQFNDLTGDKTAFKFFATRSDIAQAHGAGFANVKILDCEVSDFNVGVDMVTDLTGWLNGNNININMNRIVNAVRIHRSSQSLGVDNNIFKLYIQCGQNTKQLFIDGGKNNYDGCTIWDMKTHTNARIGTALVKNIQDGVTYPKQRYADYLLRRSYHLVGRFVNLSKFVNNVTLSVVSHQNYRVDYYVRGGETPSVERRNLGSDERLHDSFDFYIKPLDNGEYELYIHNPSGEEIECVISIESFRSFFPSPVTWYNEVEGLQKLTVRDYYLDIKNRIERVTIATDNTHTGLTPVNEFNLGLTYSTIRGDIPEEERGTPNNLNGMLITNRVGGVGASYNMQEFHPFGVTTYTIYRRYGATDTTWGAWSTPLNS